MGKKWVKIGGFREFRQKYLNDLVHFLRERKYYSITYAGKVSSPERYWFLRYGLKWGVPPLNTTTLRQVHENASVIRQFSES